MLDDRLECVDCLANRRSGGKTSLLAISFVLQKASCPSGMQTKLVEPGTLVLILRGLRIHSLGRVDSLIQSETAVLGIEQTARITGLFPPVANHYL